MVVWGSREFLLGGDFPTVSGEKGTDTKLAKVRWLRGMSLLYLGVSKNNGTPKSSHLFIGFSIIFTIHFGGLPPPFLVQHPFESC